MGSNDASLRIVKAWQHGDCMGYSPHEDKMNSVYYCEKCSYRKVDRVRWITTVVVVRLSASFVFYRTLLKDHSHMVGYQDVRTTLHSGTMAHLSRKVCFI